jgi:lactaldehyde reductase
MTIDEAAEAACKAIEELSALVGTNKRLSELGITENDIEALAEQAINDVCTPGNPRPVSKQDIIELYHQIL